MCRDTDVLLMLIAHLSTIGKQVCMKAGTKKKAKYIPVNKLVQAWNLQPNTAHLLLSFHAITGSDCTSFLDGPSKNTELKVFHKHSMYQMHVLVWSAVIAQESVLLEDQV